MSAGKPVSYAIKRIFDVLVAVSLLLLLSPVLLIISLLIKLDDGGPVFFRQERLGRRTQTFRVWKFRTMLVDADRFLDEEGKPTRDRITRVGRTLRRYSLDELPQLLNVVTGEMSLVGPRPTLPEHLHRYNETQKGRFAVRPGITGLAQINGRNDLPWSERFKFDLQYIEHYSLWQDLKILIKTAIVLVKEPVDTLDRNPGDVNDLGKDKREQ